MMTFGALVKRNMKVYFKDKGVFWTSLITPLILLLLFVTFLKNVYVDSFNGCLPEGVVVAKDLVGGFVGGWLISSLLATCSITVAFCANMIMVQDKVTGAYNDLMIAPVKKSVLALSYYVATAAVTMIINLVALGAGMIYLAVVGWHLSFVDVICTILDVILLVLFGTALSSIVCRFLKSQGGISAVGSIVSSAYGFICGAYMPISQFGEGLRNLLMFLPGTYGTGLFRNHLMKGVCKDLVSSGMPQQAVDMMTSGFDIDLSFFGNKVSVGAMYLVVGLSTLLLVGVFVLLTAMSIKKHNKKENKVEKKDEVKA